MSFPAPTTTRTPDLKEQLAQIGLVALADCIDDFLARASKGRFSPRQVVEEIVRLELTEGAKRSLERRLERSRIGRFKPIADFDWNWPKKIERDVVERALTLDFVEEHRNLVLLGANGVGKTMIAKNLAYQAALSGHSVLFVTAAELLDDLRSEVAQTTFRRKLTKYASPQILVIDEVGYLSYDHHAADAADEARKHLLSFRSDPRRTDLGDGLVEARHEALLELRRAKLLCRPAELLGNDDLDVQGAPVGRVEETVADTFSLQEGIGAIDRALNDSRGLLRAQAERLELLGSGRNSKADREDTLLTPVALRRPESIASLLLVDPGRKSGCLCVAGKLAVQPDDDRRHTLLQLWLSPLFEDSCGPLPFRRSLGEPRLYAPQLVYAGLGRGI